MLDKYDIFILERVVEIFFYGGVLYFVGYLELRFLLVRVRRFLRIGKVVKKKRKNVSLYFFLWLFIYIKLFVREFWGKGYLVEKVVY